MCLCITPAVIYAQKTLPTKYFDDMWNPIRNRAKASFYRIAEQGADGTYKVVDYYISGKRQMEAVCWQVEPKLTTREPATLYYENGGRKQEGQFVEERPRGIHKYYSEEGNLEYEINHKGEAQKYVSYRSPDGTNLLVNGNAIVSKTIADGNIAYQEFVDSVNVATYIVTDRDTTYHLSDEPPSYKGGYLAMYKEVQKSISYPKPSRRLGIEGKVYVKIIVGRNGLVKEATVVKGLDKLCNDEALAAVNQTKNWIPAKHKNKEVVGAVVLPITFRLN
jgi:TonB family protein